jgi:hypothetical protein
MEGLEPWLYGRENEMTDKLKYLCCVLALFSVFFACTGCRKSDKDPIIPSGTPQDPMPGDANVIFLHHSTGNCVWNGGVPAWLANYNTANATTYAITETSYPNAPYPWNNYPYDYWNIWVDNAGAMPFNGQDTLEILTQNYDVIVFKHCYPVSGVLEDTGSPDISSSAKRAENYKLQYNALKAKMLSFPANRFIVWTGAALVESSTSAEAAARAKAFFDWVKAEWDEPGDNIYIWDFWQLETAGGLYLLDSYAAAPGDSHPGATFCTTVAPYFAQRTVNVIKGLGDTTSLTGQ